MKRFSISVCLLIVAITSVYSQEMVSQGEKASKFKDFLAKLTPEHSKVQYAGSIGIFSASAGWMYGKDRWETDIIVGFLPKTSDNDQVPTFTLKQTYIPWNYRIKNSPFEISPLTCGIFFSTIFGDDFWVKEPDRYGGRYYGFSTQIRMHLYVGQSITYRINNNKQIFKSVSLYYELSTCDMYLISAINNKYLKPRDYLSLGLGLKFQFSAGR